MERVAVLMLSWLRLESLLQTLTQIPTTCSEPLHLCLRVQGAERLSKAQQQAIHHAASGFSSTDIYFTRDNVGTAGARLDLVHRAAKKGFPYLLFTDDDITFPPQGIDLQVKFLDEHPDFGSISLKPHGINIVQIIDEQDKIKLIPFSDYSPSPNGVYLIGSASLMFRSELYTKYLLAPDPAYYIGTWDWDFVTQIKSAGFKLGVIHDKEILNRRGGCKEYRTKRSNRQYLGENRKLFFSKWGFDPITMRQTSSSKKCLDPG